jgi:hypothetical protein
VTTPQQDPTQLTDAELDTAIIAASRAYIAARTARPQDPVKVTAAKAWLDQLMAERAARG